MILSLNSFAANLFESNEVSRKKLKMNAVHSKSLHLLKCFLCRTITSNFFFFSFVLLMEFIQCTNLFFLWIYQQNIFRNTACCPLKKNNGLLYKFDHYEDDFADLTEDYGCMTGSNIILFLFHSTNGLFY